MRQRRTENIITGMQKNRGEEGFLLIESIVAIGILSIVMVAIMDGIALSYRQSSATQNQVLATNIADQLFSDVRNSTWATLSGFAGQTLSNTGGQIVLNKTSANQSGSVLHPRAILNDFSNGSVFTAAGQNNIFRGNVTETLTLLAPDQIQVAVTVSWPGENGTGQHQLTNSTVVSQYGIHN